MFLGQGVLLALIDREKTGRGQWVHTSLLEGMLCKLDFQGARFTMSGDVPEQQGNDHPTIFPMGTFRCKDGFVNIAAPTEKMWRNFLDAIEDQKLRKMEKYRSPRNRNQHKDELREDIESALAEFTVDELVARVNAVAVPCGPINDVEEGFSNPQSTYLKMTKRAPHPSLGDLELIRSPINLSEHPHGDEFERPAPNPGEHSKEVLAEFGISEERIDSLHRNGVISS